MAEHLLEVRWPRVQVHRPAERPVGDWRCFGSWVVARQMATLHLWMVEGLGPLSSMDAFVEGNPLLAERVDVFKLPNKSFELPVMGIFEVSDGKISAWRDYFDMNQFTSRMG